MLFKLTVTMSAFLTRDHGYCISEAEGFPVQASPHPSASIFRHFYPLFVLCLFVFLSKRILLPATKDHLYSNIWKDSLLSLCPSNLCLIYFLFYSTLAVVSEKISLWIFAIARCHQVKASSCVYIATFSSFMHRFNNISYF